MKKTLRSLTCLLLALALLFSLAACAPAGGQSPTPATPTPQATPSVGPPEGIPILTPPPAAGGDEGQNAPA